MAGIEHHNSTSEPDQRSDDVALSYTPRLKKAGAVGVRRRTLARISLVLLALAIFFGLGRFSVRWRVPSFYPAFDPSGDNTTVSDDAAQFADLVKRWDGFVTARGGYLPEDPYCALIEAQTVVDFDELRPIHFAPALPPRLNPTLSQNPHWVVFWETRPDLKEIWECYADGTWARTPDHGVQNTSFEQHNPRIWNQVYRIANFPKWTRKGDRDAWVAKHRNQLTWDSSSKLYVVASKAN